MNPAVIVLIGALLFSAFSSGMEMAFVASNRLKVELDRSKLSLFGRMLNLFYGNEGHFLAFILLANNIALVVFGIYAAEMLNPIIHGWGIESGLLVLLLQTVLSTLLILIFAEFLPKTFIQLNPNVFFRWGAGPMALLYWVLYFPTRFIVLLSHGFLRIFGVKVQQSEKVFSKTDLQHFVADMNERMEDEADLGNEMQILQNALDFSKIKARDCMIPRTEIVAIDVEESIEALAALFIETRLSKLLVYRDSIDNIIGYVHSFEMFRKPEGIKQLLRPISFVPESVPGKELLEMFTKQSSSIVVVVDEYGGTSGIITIEDVIEEIFGEIEDEHDDEDWLEEQISDKVYRFSARAEVSYLNRTYGFQLPESEAYETLGGMVIHQLESIPEADTTIEFDNYTLFMEEVTERRIEVIRLELG
ncbi:MAG: HlyC/CorC family transporter [Flavobacteriia bacterium]|nr:HlyC/CorC family transporter [Flavobacteriia bacterium]